MVRRPTPGCRRPARAAGVAALLFLAACGGREPREEPPPCIVPDPVEAASFEWRMGDFYERLSNRRFNSIATFSDPALREFFESLESFSDYYADLAQALAGANFEANRPNEVYVDGVCFERPDAVRVDLRFVGEDGRPLRWWTTRLRREDRWERRDERWWIIPGKV